MSAEDTPLTYRLITGPDDRSFCERISAALDDGYILHGGPAVTFNGTTVIAAQAVILPHAVAHADSAIADAVLDLEEDEEFDGEGIA